MSGIRLYLEHLRLVSTSGRRLWRDLVGLLQRKKKLSKYYRRVTK